MKYAAPWFAVAFVLAIAQATSLVIQLAGLGLPAEEMLKRAGRLLGTSLLLAGVVMICAAITTVLYGVTRRLYRWAVK